MVTVTHRCTYALLLPVSGKIEITKRTQDGARTSQRNQCMAVAMRQLPY